MKKLLMAATALCALASPVRAQVAEDDPLHLCYSTGCSSFGGVTIGGLGGGTTGFGVSSSPAPQTGTLFFALLTPNNEPELTLPSLSGFLNGNPLTVEAGLSEGTFGSGLDLKNILALALGGSGNPPNPFSAFAGATLLEDPGFTSYDVSLFKVDGSFTTGAQAGQTSVLDNTFSFSGGKFGLLDGIGPGSIITAFLVETGIDKHGNPFIDVVSTAQSSALLVTPFAGPPVPEPSTWAMGLIGFAFLGFLGYRKSMLAV